MKSPRPLFPAFCVALLALVFLPACAKRETPVEEGLRTHTLLVGNEAEPATLDPHLVTLFIEMRVTLALFEGLTVLDERTAAPLPGAAERWSVSPDGLTYTFHLRPNGRWSDGQPVTAADFAYSFRRILEPKLGSQYAYMLWPIRNAEAFNTARTPDFSVVGVKAVDDLTLQLTLERPTAYLLSLAAHSTWFPISRRAVEKAGRMDARESSWTRPGHLVGNGAFVLGEWRPNARIVVAKNPHYWGAADNRLERVVLFPIENSDAEERAFRAGQLHVTGSLPPSKIPVYRRESPDRLRLDPFLATNYVSFNTTKPPLNHPKVRQALALAIDRGAISARIYESAFAPASVFVPPNCGAYTPPAVGQKTDFAAARALLADAGFPGGAGLPVMSLQVINDDKQPKAAEAIQAMWQRELGVRITIEPMEQKTLNHNLNTLSHTLGIGRWVADYPDPGNFLDIFMTGNSQNDTGWSNREYDALLGEARSTIDAAKRFALLQRAEEILLREAPLAPLIHGARTFVMHPFVKNWEPSPLGLNRYQMLRLER